MTDTPTPDTGPRILTPADRAAIREHWDDGKYTQHSPAYGVDVLALLDTCDALEAQRDIAQAAADRIGLAYIEVTNPGIDMDEVRRLRTRPAIREDSDG